MARCECKPDCRFTADEGHPFALAHDRRPERAVAHRELLQARAAAGGAKAQERSRGRKRKSCTLRSIDDLLAELERTLVDVENSGGEAVAKATAKTKIIAEARATLTRELESELRDLKALIAERFPDLRKHLKAVS